MFVKLTSFWLLMSLLIIGIIVYVGNLMAKEILSCYLIYYKCCTLRAYRVYASRTFWPNNFHLLELIDLLSYLKEGHIHFSSVNYFRAQTNTFFLYPYSNGFLESFSNNVEFIESQNLKRNGNFDSFDYLNRVEQVVLFVIVIILVPLCSTQVAISRVISRMTNFGAFHSQI